MNHPKLYILSLFIISLLISCTKEVVTITITNELPVARAFETVELTKDVLKQTGITDLSLYGIKDKSGTQQTIQYVDTNNDGNVNVLLFQPEIEANTAKEFSLFKRDTTSTKDSVICYARFVPERTDDYAWENDKVAFRMFGPTAQKMFENGEQGGTLSSGIDCWLKKVEYPIINKWYKKYTENTGSYHEDTGEGLDNFHVGASRGCGGLAIKQDSIYITPKNFAHHKTITNGEIRTQFLLTYEDWNASEEKIKHTLLISLDRGSNLSKIEVKAKDLDKISTGLTLHEKDGKITENTDNNWISYWQPHGDSELGTAILTTANFFNSFNVYDVEEKDKSNAFLQLNFNNDVAVYYTGFGWKKSKQFNTQKQWNAYLDDFAVKLKTPLKISVSK